MRLIAGWLAFILTMCVAPCQAQELPADTRERIDWVEQRAAAMFILDQAAWHATDSFLPELDEAIAPMMRGYIVVPREGGLVLDAIFYGEAGGQLVEVAKYGVEADRVIDGGFLPAESRPVLSPVALAMVAAKDAAVNEVIEQEFSLCSNSQPNTLVLPPDEMGNIDVYLMTSTSNPNSYPLGGHYRVTVGPDGNVIASRRFLKSCFDIPIRADVEGMLPQAFVVSHVLDDEPTEIHAFASRNVPIAIMVVTTNNRKLWTVRNGAIEFEQVLDE